MEPMRQVPLSLLKELAKYAIDDQDEERVLVPDNGEWTRSMVQDLKQECRVRGYHGAIAVGDAAAASAETPVLIHNIATDAKHKQQISSDLGAMSKAATRMFGKKRWPFRALDSNSGMTYLMQAKIAEWWTEI